MHRLTFAVVAAAIAISPLRAQAPSSLPDSAYARLVFALSDTPGYFDTDNLISNEDAYLHPVSILRRVGTKGGAYLGVGPDQNFSYIAAVRPNIAFIIDIRRDNLLEHVMFKSIFALARNRLEFLCLLFGRAAPADPAGWAGRDVDELLRYIDGAPADAAMQSRIRTRVLEQVRRSPLRLSTADVETIGRFHLTFIRDGPSLRFNTFGRAPQAYYPDFRRLARETDREGTPASYLAREIDFQFVKNLHDRNLVVPLTGDFGQGRAITAVGDWLRERGEKVSAFYTSNVEQYLFRDGSFPRFARAVAQLPRDNRSVMIRSYFLGGHPQTRPGYHVAQVVQYLDRFSALQAAGGIVSYDALVMREVIPP